MIFNKISKGIVLFGVAFQLASHIKKCLDQTEKMDLKDDRKCLYWQLHGIYISRIFGVCIYRCFEELKPKCSVLEIDKLKKENRLLRKVCSDFVVAHYPAFKKHTDNIDLPCDEWDEIHFLLGISNART